VLQKIAIDPYAHTLLTATRAPLLPPALHHFLSLRVSRSFHQVSSSAIPASSSFILSRRTRGARILENYAKNLARDNGGAKDELRQAQESRDSSDGSLVLKWRKRTTTPSRLLRPGSSSRRCLALGNSLQLQQPIYSPRKGTSL